MHAYPISGVRDGTLQAERDGLYWNIRAECSRDWDHPIRLLAETDGAATILGVPQPEGDRLCLQCRLSNRSCPFSERTQIRTDQTPEPELETDPEQESASAPELLPFEPEQPFARISEFSVMDVVEQDGKPYWKAPD